MPKPIDPELEALLRPLSAKVMPKSALKTQTGVEVSNKMALAHQRRSYGQTKAMKDQHDPEDTKDGVARGWGGRGY